jgi:hypothetical protein
MPLALPFFARSSLWQAIRHAPQKLLIGRFICLPGMYLMKNSGQQWLIYISLLLHAPSSMGNVELAHPLVAE